MTLHNYVGTCTYHLLVDVCIPYLLSVSIFWVSDDLPSGGDEDDWKVSERSRSPSLPKVEFKSKTDDGKVLHIHNSGVTILLVSTTAKI